MVEIVSSTLLITDTTLQVIDITLQVTDMGVIIINYDLMQDDAVISLIESTVKNFIISQPAHIRQFEEEIKNIVLLACWQRQDAYDPTKSKSVTFFKRRTQGAIQDWMRSNSPFSRGFHKKNPDVKLYVFSSIKVENCHDEGVAEDFIEAKFTTIKADAARSLQDVEVQDFIGSLFNGTPKLLEIIKLRKLGYKNKEIGSRLGCSEATISSNIKQIRKILRAQYGPNWLYGVKREKKCGRVTQRLCGEGVDE